MHYAVHQLIPGVTNVVSFVTFIHPSPKSIILHTIYSTTSNLHLAVLTYSSPFS